MKKLRLAVLAACGFLLIFAGCSARIEEAADAFPEEAADWLSTDAGRDAGPALSAPEPDSPSPALTLADIRTAYVSDLSDGDGYADYIRYVVCRDFMQTDGDGTLSPQTAVTREQLALFLYRFAAEGPADRDTIDAYRDGGLVEEYARAPLAWALGRGVFDGMAADVIYPSLPVSRMQLAQVLAAYAAYIEEEPLAQTLAGQLKIRQAESAVRARHDDIQEQIDAATAKYGVTGLQVAVVEDGRVADSFSYGWAVKGVTPMTPDHKIRSASITKVAVGMAAMILKEDGVIDLDESIGTYWGVAVQNPSHPDAAVSIRTLLSHSSSLKVFSWEISRSRDNVRSILQSGGCSARSPWR